MAEKPEDGAPQNPAPAAVTLTAEEIADLKHKAEVSSQNFERAKKAEKEAEELRVQLQAKPPEDKGGEFSEEAKVLLGKISALEALASTNAQKETLKTLETSHPALKDKSTEFETFRNDPVNAGMSMSTAAKAFLVENNLYEAPKPRPGVEKPAGGGRVPTPGKMTAEDVADLRNTNFRKYSQLVREGKIDLN